MIEPFNIGGKMNNTDILLEQSRCISHEIRNHLSICELYSQIIRKNLENEGINNESIDNALNCIGKSIKIMGNSLLDLKSLNNFSYTYCNIKDIVEEGVKLSEVYTHGKTIDITTSFNGSAKVYIDENKFLACIVNIIKNAIEDSKMKALILTESAGVSLGEIINIDYSWNTIEFYSNPFGSRDLIMYDKCCSSEGSIDVDIEPEDINVNALNLFILNYNLYKLFEKN